MARWFPRLMVIAVGVQFIVYAIRPLLSYQAIAQGAGVRELGLLTASFSVLSLMSALPLGRGVDRWGEIYFVMAGTALIGLVALVLLTSPGLLALGLCNAALGVSHLSTVVGIQTLIAKGSLADRRDARFASFTTLNALGQLLGPAVAGLLIGNVTASAALTSSGGVANAHRVFITAASVAGIALLAAISLRLVPGTLAARPAAVGSPARASLKRVLTLPSMPSAMFASLTVLSSSDLLAAYLPAYGEAQGISVQTVGFLLAVQGIAALVARLAMLRLIAALTRQRLLALSMLLAAAGMASLPLLHDTRALFAAMVVVGFGLGLGQPITLAWVAGQAPREIRGTAMSVRLSGNRLGQTVVPVAVGAIAGAGGLAAVFVSPAVLLALGGSLVLAAARRVRNEPD